MRNEDFRIHLNIHLNFPLDDVGAWQIRG
jgi:hypothetical protein